MTKEESKKIKEEVAQSEETEVKNENVEEMKVEENKSEEVEVKENKDKKESEPKEISKKATIVKEAEAVINIYTSFNNTIVHVTDMSGKTITKVTGGMVTKQDRLKANPTIGMFIAKRIAEEVKDTGIKSFYIRIRPKTRNPAPGPGAHTIVKSLTREGFKILNILDMTRLPRGGPKKKGGRRGRRP
jgi:small subunit ribosomal protein S11